MLEYVVIGLLVLIVILIIILLFKKNNSSDVIDKLSKTEISIIKELSDLGEILVVILMMILII